MSSAWAAMVSRSPRIGRGEGARADADRHLAGLQARDRRVACRSHSCCRPTATVGLAVAEALEVGLDQIHLRRADEARHENIGGLGEHLVRDAHLLDQAVAHDGDAVGHGQGLELVVGDDHGRLGEALTALP